MLSPNWLLSKHLRSMCVALPTLILFVSFAFSPAEVIAQSSPGDTTLDKAFSAKLDAKSTRDLDKVVDLCEKAIEEGLDEEGVEQAKQLAAAALYEHAERRAQPILVQMGRDRRWQYHRRQALTRLKKATEYQPKMASAWLLITKLHGLPGGDSKRAAEAVEKAIELAGDDRRQLSAALFLRAGIAGRTGDEDTLLADLDQAIKIDPDNTQAYQVRGLYYLRKRNPEKALDDLNRWLKSSDRALDSVLVVDRLIAMDDKFDGPLQDAALEILNNAIEKDPQSPDPYYKRAQVHSIRKDVDAALADVDKAMELSPETDRLSRFRVQLLIDAERWDEANRAIDDFLDKNPDDEQMSRLRMVALIYQSKYEEAIVQVRKLIRMSPDNVWLRQRLGELYASVDRPSQAIRVYSRLLDEVSAEKVESAPDRERLILLSTRSSLLQRRGNARLSTGEHKEAIEDYDEALDLGYQLRELQDELDLGLSLDPEDAVQVGVLNNFAWVLATSPVDELRDGERAIELATEAAEKTEFKEAYILSTLASGYAETGDFAKALLWINKAIAVNAEEGEKIKENGGDKDELTRNAKQSESLNNEKASYVEKRPWRERQNVEEEKRDAEASGDADGENPTEPDLAGDDGESPDTEAPKSEPPKDAPTTDKNNEGSKQNGKPADESSDSAKPNPPDGEAAEPNTPGADQPAPKQADELEPKNEKPDSEAPKSGNEPAPDSEDENPNKI